ncbi:sugar phosphate isomerase/epimerase family protein [Streptomonospora nanhaiensis]|uniref:Sugar phosphate isomerase/epimerase n=1 Tax=Streptomonospora nanhaiensis TaxID=1323731 RepID=A0A853BSB5_9ACTN|nr:sugar phosphate isomerase/epimerase family protein [Streptomonospora nanhaiensis]MBV2366209.1 sugar phosphate isomerase/epimerase [Streptomonospora nanhaiensis]NYI98278.1 sugar phosphate isomerase/epimerase [Streptomonospora nanhaiensis]
MSGAPAGRWAGCLNPATVTGAPLPQVIALAARSGLDFVEASIQQVLALGPARVGDLLAEHGVGIAAASGVLPAGPVLPAPLLTRDPQTFDGLTDRLAAMAAVGCPVATVLLNPATDTPYPAAHDRAVARLQMLTRAAAEHGITLAVEAVGAPRGHGPALSGRHPFVTALPHLARLLDAVAAPNAGVCLDAFHWAATGADPAHITRLGHRITHVQVADAPHRIPRGRWEDQMRLFPGDGALDWAAFTAALAAAGYTGPLSVELFNPHLRALPEQEIADRAAAAVHRIAREVAG